MTILVFLSVTLSIPTMACVFLRMMDGLDIRDELETEGMCCVCLCLCVYVIITEHCSNCVAGCVLTVNQAFEVDEAIESDDQISDADSGE